MKKKKIFSDLLTFFPICIIICAKGINHTQKCQINEEKLQYAARNFYRWHQRRYAGNGERRQTIRVLPERKCSVYSRRNGHYPADPQILYLPRTVRPLYSCLHRKRKGRSSIRRRRLRTEPARHRDPYA